MCEWPAPVPDEALAARANSGCRDCFSLLYGRYRMTLARYLHESFSCDFDTALDIEAEAWKRAFQHLVGYRGDRPFKAWLLAITRNLALNHIRHARRAPDPDALLRSSGNDGSPLEQLERREAIDQCVRLVRNLPVELREPFILRTLFDLDLRSVADLLDLSEDTARGRLYRARKSLADSVKGVRS